MMALLEAEADLNTRDKSDSTPLHLAAGMGTPEAVAVLLEAGADLNARDDYDRTSLHLASRHGTAETITALLKAGADPAARDSDDKLPFDYAEDNEQLKGTDVYLKLKQVRFQ